MQHTTYRSNIWNQPEEYRRNAEWISAESSVELLETEFDNIIEREVVEAI